VLSHANSQCQASMPDKHCHCIKPQYWKPFSWIFAHRRQCVFPLSLYETIPANWTTLNRCAQYKVLEKMISCSQNSNSVGVDRNWSFPLLLGTLITDTIGWKHFSWYHTMRPQFRMIFLKQWILLHDIRQMLKILSSTLVSWSSSEIINVGVWYVQEDCRRSSN
jgi:hypothetical protein